MSAPENPEIPELCRRRRQLRILFWIVVPATSLAIACLRFEVFASPSASPSSKWRELFSHETIPLQNVPVVISSQRENEEFTVAVANRGTTTLCYRSAGPSNVQSFQEFEEMGTWAAGNWDWCGTGKENFEIVPGEQVNLSVTFWDAKRERMLAEFREKGTNRRGMIVLASEGPQLSLDVKMLRLLSSAAFTAFCIWLVVRIVNRRERWAIWMMLAVTVAGAVFAVAQRVWSVSLDSVFSSLG